MSSETEDNWEDISSTTSDDEESFTATHSTHKSPVTKTQTPPWSPPDPPKEKPPNLPHQLAEKTESETFEKPENELRFLDSLTENGKLDFSDAKTAQKVFNLVKFGYRQVGYDTNKPIIVEFDSLFINILQNDQFVNCANPAAQFLPLAYAAEKFLARLCSSGRFVEVHCFRCFDRLHRDSVTRLARKALIRHIASLSGHRGWLRVKAKFFPHWQSLQWTQHRKRCSPAFVMISACPDFQAGRESFRALQHWIRCCALFLAAEEVPFVRLEEFFFFSNALYGFIAQVFKETRAFLAERLSSICPDSEGFSPRRNEENDGGKKAADGLQSLVAASISSALRNEGGESQREAVSAAKAFLLSFVARRSLSLEQRLWLLENFHDNGVSAAAAGSDRFLDKFCGDLCDVVESSSDASLEGFSDLVDSRFTAWIRQSASADADSFQQLFDAETKQTALQLWAKVATTLPRQFSDPFSIEPSTEAPSNPQRAETKTFALHQIENGAFATITADFDSFLGERGLLFADGEEEPGEADEEIYICNELEEEIKNAENNAAAAGSKFQSKFYPFMKKYSESLAQPKIVLRDVVVEDLGKEEKGEGEAKAKGKRKGKKKAKNDRRQKIMEQTNNRKKLREKADLKIFIEQALRPLSLERKIEKLDEKLLPMKDPVIALPGQMQLLEWLKELYKNSDAETNKTPGTRLFRTVYDIYRRFASSLNLEQFNKLQSALIMMGFFAESGKLVEQFNALKKKAVAKPISGDNDLYCQPAASSCVYFQLKYAGHFMVRSIKSREDSRVSGFFPDDWQRSFLDAVDRRESCLVVTPTSSGKTFISYYAMKQVLNENKAIERRSERGFVVFVCPSKALVNQVSADIYGRYGEIFGVDALDYSRNVAECQVLVTVPEAFERILLAPPFESFVRRIKYVIMDEIHSIGDPVGGEIWERVVQMIQCPFIALSATLGNPRIFHGWLQKISADSTQPGNSAKVHLIEFYERWSDLEKYIYIPTNAAEPRMSLGDFEGQAGGSSMEQINPLSAFKLGVCSEENFALSNISLSSNDCLKIYEAISAFANDLDGEERNDLRREIRPLDPENYFTSLCITKNEVTEYGKSLKAKLAEWNCGGHWRRVDAILELLSEKLLAKIAKMERQNISTEENGEKPGEDPKSTLPPLPGTSSKSYGGPYSEDFLVRQIIPMLVELKNQKDLPAIVFANSQKLCDAMALETLKFFETNEKFVLSSSDLKERKRNKKQQLKQVKAWKRERDRIDKRKEEEMLKEGQIPNVEIENDEDEFDHRFSFIGPGEHADEDDVHFWLVRTLRKNNWSKSHPFLRCINRGIAVHHNGMSRAYKTLVEVLFRAKHIKVVLTVGTLALGVNMPCRTTVFAGDSAELTPLRYRQMMGRAGRRGYDNIGKVIFFGVPPQKISYLMTSVLRSLSGHETMTMTTFLRSLFCLSMSSDKAFRLRSLQNMTKLTFGSQQPSAEEEADCAQKMRVYFRFAAEYLLQNQLVTKTLAPAKLAGLVARLHCDEPANFVFPLMLQAGVFDDITASVDISSNPDKTKNQKNTENQICCRLLEVMAHLFHRVPHPSDFVKPPFYNSQIVLKPLEPTAKAVLDRFNQTTVALFGQFFRLGALRGEAGAASPPLQRFARTSRKDLGAEQKRAPGARSDFVAVAGKGDDFGSGQEMLFTAKSKVPFFRNSDSIPVVECKDYCGRDLRLSAYVLDFFKQGSLRQLIKENNLPELFAWTMLKKWSVTLKNIAGGLTHIRDFGDCGGLERPGENVSAEQHARRLRNLCYCFGILQENFEALFRKIGDVVEYNYQ